VDFVTSTNPVDFVTVTVTINGLVKLSPFNAHICPSKYLVCYGFHDNDWISWISFKQTGKNAVSRSVSLVAILYDVNDLAYWWFVWSQGRKSIL